MNITRMLFVAVLSTAGIAASAQTVYRSTDKAGAPSFSDTPSPGASAVELAAPNVVSTPAIAPQPPAAQAQPLAHYRTLRITQPAQQGMVHTNTGAFDVVAQLQPPLRPGDRVRVSLDGNVLSTAFRSTRLHLSETDWDRAATSDNGEHTLQMAIVDAQDNLLIESEPVRFYARHAAVGGARHRR